MRVAILNLTSACVRGGVENKLWHLSRQLIGFGHDVTLLMGRGPMSDPLGTEGLRIKRFPYIPRAYLPCGGSRFRKAIERWSMTPWVAGPLLFGKYDAVVVNKPYDLPLAFAVRKLCGTRVCFISGGGEVIPGFRRMAEASDSFFVTSEDDRARVQEQFGLDPIANPSGVDAEMFRPVPRDTALAAKHGIEEGDVVVVTPGRLEPVKGQAIALEAVALLRDRLGAERRLRYVLMGDGSCLADLKKQARSLGLEDNVLFMGALPQAEMVGFYSLATVALIPSQVEALGIAVSEAMACRVPVVASAVGGIPCQVVEGAGVLVDDFDDPRAYVEGLWQAVTDPDARRGWIEVGAAHVAANFTWERYARVIEAALLADPSREAMPA